MHFYGVYVNGLVIKKEPFHRGMSRFTSREDAIHQKACFTQLHSMNMVKS